MIPIAHDAVYFNPWSHRVTGNVARVDPPNSTHPRQKDSSVGHLQQIGCGPQHGAATVEPVVPVEQLEVDWLRISQKLHCALSPDPHHTARPIHPYLTGSRLDDSLDAEKGV